jgi:hypothetical protein
MISCLTLHDGKSLCCDILSLQWVLPSDLEYFVTYLVNLHQHIYVRWYVTYVMYHDERKTRCILWLMVNLRYYASYGKREIDRILRV